MKDCGSCGERMNMIIEKLMDKEELSETEKQIAQYILNKENNIEDITSTELGKRSYTSQSAVTRLYKKLGVKTYREFISKAIVERNEYFNNKDIFDQLLLEQLSTYSGIQKVISGLYMQTINNTNRVMDKNVIIRFCNRVISSKIIDIYAIGESESLANLMSSKLQSLGICCSCHSHYNPLYVRNIQNKAQRVSMIIDVDNQNEAIINIAKGLKENKCYTVSICSTKQKELMLYCQDNINFSIGSYEDYYYICDMFAVEYIFNIIYLILSTRRMQ